MNNLNSSPHLFKVPTPLGWATLPLIVDATGGRWLALGLVSHTLGLSMGGYTLPRTEKPSWGRRRVDGHECLPVDRCPQFFTSIKEGSVPAPARPFLFWARMHAFRAMSDFTVPTPVVPMLEVEPEPAPVPVVATPKIETGLQTFNFGALPVRVALKSGEPLWVASDACNLLDLTNVGQAIASLDDDEKMILNHGDLVSMGIINRDDLEITRLAFVSESGLYSLIFKSRKPEAKAFKRWIAHEVIPSIRKTGGYGMQTLPDFSNPATAARAWAEQFEQRQTLACKVESQAEELKVAEPAIRFHAQVGAAKDVLTIGEFAKMLGTGQNRLFSWLRERGYIMKSLTTPYQTWVNAGLFIVKEIAFEDAHGVDRVNSKTYITGKGQVRIQAEWNGCEGLAS